MFVGDTPDYGVSLAESGAEKITQFNEELDITEN